jgi:hypothetical protein
MIDPQLESTPLAVSNRTLRQFAGLWMCFFAALAWYEWFSNANLALVSLLAVLSVLVGPLGLVTPQAIRPVFVGLLTVSYPVGWVVSHLLFALIFYGIFTPIGLVFKLIGRDALLQRDRQTQTTYWREDPTPSDVRSYFRQS